MALRIQTALPRQSPAHWTAAAIKCHLNWRIREAKNIRLRADKPPPSSRLQPIDLANAEWWAPRWFKYPPREPFKWNQPHFITILYVFAWYLFTDENLPLIFQQKQTIILISISYFSSTKEIKLKNQDKILNIKFCFHSKNALANIIWDLQNHSYKNFA